MYALVQFNLPNQIFDLAWPKVTPANFRIIVVKPTMFDDYYNMIIIPPIIIKIVR